MGNREDILMVELLKKTCPRLRSTTKEQRGFHLHRHDPSHASSSCSLTFSDSFLEKWENWGTPPNPRQGAPCTPSLRPAHICGTLQARMVAILRSRRWRA